MQTNTNTNAWITPLTAHAYSKLEKARERLSELKTHAEACRDLAAVSRAETRVLHWEAELALALTGKPSAALRYAAGCAETIERQYASDNNHAAASRAMARLFAETGLCQYAYRAMRLASLVTDKRDLAWLREATGITVPSRAVSDTAHRLMAAHKRQTKSRK